MVALLQRGFNNLSLVPTLTAMVRWQNYRYVLRQSLSFFQNDFAGRIAQKVMQTGPSLRETVRSLIDGIWTLTIYVGGTIWLFAGLDPWLIAPVAVWLALYVLTIWKLVPPVRQRSAAVAEANSGLSGRIVDSYTNIQSVKLFARAEREDGFVLEGFRTHIDAFLSFARTMAGLMVSLYTINSALIVSVTGLGVYLWSRGSISVGAIAIATSLVLRLNQMSGMILRQITSLLESVGTVQNGMQTIARPYSLVDAPDATPLTVTKGAIRFEDVSFHYGRESGVIDHLTLEVKPGEKVGLVGRSGAGKSTLVNLLLRFYDTEGGRILVDGQDIAHVTQESLRAAIGVVTQDTSLLHRSVQATTSDTACRRRATRRSPPPPAGRTPTTSSPRFRICRAAPATMPASASAASSSPAASASASPSPGWSSRTRPSWSSTRRPARSIRRSRRRSRSSSTA